MAMTAGDSGGSGTSGSTSLNRLKSMGGANGRISSPAEPLIAQVQPRPAIRRLSSPAEPLTAQVQQPGGGTIPYQQARQAATAYQAPANFAPEPAVPQGPVAGGRQAYNQMDAAGQAMADEQWLGGDSDYTAQLGEYQRALDDFISRITGQKENFELDRKNAFAANEKNGAIAADQLGEDFGARGMSYSGLAAKSQGDLGTRFSEQGKNINLVAQRNNDDADNRLKDYRAENAIGTGNAKRAALARMAAQQSMIDSNAGMF